jgi:molybdate transport system regulatory protein
MPEVTKPRPAFKVWLETDEGYVFGPGVYSLLKKVRETGTLKEAAGSLGMSYRFAWGLVKKAEEKLGQPLLHSHKGGRYGGGSTELTEVGMQFLENFSKIELVVNELSREPGLLEQFPSRNQIEAEVKEIQTVGDRVDLTLQMMELTQLRVSASKKLVERMEIGVGDRVNAELTSMTVKIHKT